MQARLPVDLRRLGHMAKIIISTKVQQSPNSNNLRGWKAERIIMILNGATIHIPPRYLEDVIRIKMNMIAMLLLMLALDTATHYRKSG